MNTATVHNQAILKAPEFLYPATMRDIVAVCSGAFLLLQKEIMPRGVYIRTDEIKKKMSEAKKGKPNPHKGLRGSANHFWRGGITPKNILIRTSTEYKEWKERILKRDDYTCQYCLNQGGNLHVHHLIKFSKDKKLQMTMKNGITICKPCHWKLHGLTSKKFLKQSSSEILRTLQQYANDYYDLNNIKISLHNNFLCSLFNRVKILESIYQQGIFTTNNIFQEDL